MTIKIPLTKKDGQPPERKVKTKKIDVCVEFKVGRPSQCDTR